MSGGTFDYAGSICRDHLEEVGTHPDVQRRWPLTAQVFKGLADILYDTEYTMDYDLAGDTRIPSDAAFDMATVGAVLTWLMKVAPDEWFPRGKWATIQAIQGRSETPAQK